MQTNDYNYSVILPVKNGSKYILQALKSVIQQTTPSKSIFVIDDHSDDSTSEIVSKFIPGVKLIPAFGRGQLNAIFEGLQLVESKYVAFLDSDDYWASSKQEVQIRSLEMNRDLDAVCSGVVNFLDNELDPIDFSRNSKNFYQSRQFGATTFRVDSLREKFPLQSSGTHFQWQMDWWVKSIDEGLKFVQTNELHLYRRIHSENSWSTNALQGNRDLIDFIRKHKEGK